MWWPRLGIYSNGMHWLYTYVGDTYDRRKKHEKGNKEEEGKTGNQRRQTGQTSGREAIT
jgi:hypothetical protein